MLNWIFTILLFVSCEIFALEKNPYFQTEQDLLIFFGKSSDLNGRFGEALYNYTEKPIQQNLVSVYGSLPVSIYNQEQFRIVDNCQCEQFEEDSYLLYHFAKDSVMEGQGKLGGMVFEKGKKFGDYPKSEMERLLVGVRFLVQKFIELKVEEVHAKATNQFKVNKKSVAMSPIIEIMNYRKWKYSPLDSSNMSQYNDFGFFLEQGGKYQEAVTLLEDVLKLFPTRTVAYLNCGDAYSGLGNGDEAKKKYRKYIDLMKASGKEKKVSSRVLKLAK